MQTAYKLYTPPCRLRVTETERQTEAHGGIIVSRDRGQATNKTLADARAETEHKREGRLQWMSSAQCERITNDTQQDRERCQVAAIK